MKKLKFCLNILFFVCCSFAFTNTAHAWEGLNSYTCEEAAPLFRGFMSNFGPKPFNEAHEKANLGKPTYEINDADIEAVVAKWSQCQGVGGLNYSISDFRKGYVSRVNDVKAAHQADLASYKWADELQAKIDNLHNAIIEIQNTGTENVDLSLLHEELDEIHDIYNKEGYKHQVAVILPGYSRNTLLLSEKIRDLESRREAEGMAGGIETKLAALEREATSKNLNLDNFVPKVYQLERNLEDAAAIGLDQLTQLNLRRRISKLYLVAKESAYLPQYQASIGKVHQFNEAIAAQEGNRKALVALYKEINPQISAELDSLNALTDKHTNIDDTETLAQARTEALSSLYSLYASNKEAIQGLDIEETLWLIGIVAIVPHLILAVLYYIKLSMSYLHKSSIRVRDIRKNFNIHIVEPIACGGAVAALCGVYLLPSGTIDVFFAQILIGITTLISTAYFSMVTAVVYLGFVVNDEEDFIVAPVDMKSYTIVDYISLRFIVELCKPKVVPLSDTTRMSRGAGKELYIQGKFDSLGVFFSDKQKRDEAIALLKRLNSSIKMEAFN